MYDKAVDKFKKEQDYVYAKFFLGMLKENKGIAANLDAEIDGLIAECEKTVAKGMVKPKGKKAKK
jgi:hypothetical protein